MDASQIAADWQEGAREFEFHVTRLIILLKGNQPALVELRGLIKGYEATSIAAANGFELVAEGLSKLGL